jgi:hypothetical protein
MRVGCDDDRMERVDEIGRIDGVRAPGALPSEGIDRPERASDTGLFTASAQSAARRLMPPVFTARKPPHAAATQSERRERSCTPCEQNPIKLGPPSSVAVVVNTAFVAIS